MISDVCCVRTVRLGSPNTALLPYKMGGTLQRLLAVRSMGRDPQLREMGHAGPGVLRGGRCSPESTGSTKTTAFQGYILGGADQADSCLSFVVPQLEFILSDFVLIEAERGLAPTPRPPGIDCCW